MSGNELLEDLRNICDVDIVPLEVDRKEFEQYVLQWNYAAHYKKNMAEKALEHFVSMKLLNFGKKDVFIDIASRDSPFPKIIENLFGCEVYRQDLSYSPGIKGQTVGGDAAALPFSDCSVTKMTLHCSFEHFEGDADTRFVKEINRVLKPGGMVCILPLYLKMNYQIYTDPKVDRTGLVFDAGAEIKESPGWNNRFGRHYSPDKLKDRVLDHRGVLLPTIYVIGHEKDINSSCYLKFILMFGKMA